MFHRPLSDEAKALLVRLPWWGSVIAAAAAYGTLHPLATLDTGTYSAGSGLMGTALVRLLAGLASVAQYLLPLALIAAAAASLVLRREKRGDAGHPFAPPADLARDPPKWTGPKADADEHALGDALSALIRAARVPADKAISAATPTPRERTPRLARSGPGLRPRLVLDLLGISMTLGLAWAAYAWFSALPPASPGGLWDARTADDAAPAESTPTHTARVAGDQPLGRFDFGVPLPDPTVAIYSPEQAPAPREEPVYQYRSVHELETAFNARYIPPPECADLSTPARLASCGNHRIRARRAFIDSNGRTMDPTPPPVVAAEPPAWQDAGGNWATQQTQQEAEGVPTDPWDTQLGWEDRWDTGDGADWQGARGNPSPRSWETKPGWLGHGEERAREWQNPHEWTSPGAWEPRLQPLDDEAPRAPRMRRYDADWPPQVRRRPVEDWQSRFDPDGRFEPGTPPPDPRREDALWQQEWLRRSPPERPQDWRSQ